MKENKLEVIIGAAVLLVALGFVVFLYQSTGLSVSNSKHYELKADFRSADGIHVGTDVRLAGVKVGTVSDLGLNAETYRAEAELSIENKIVVLVDDVLFTGRSIRAALNAIQSFGRPKAVKLLTLIDRRFSRELPIQPDYCGLQVDSRLNEKVVVNWEENNDSVYLTSNNE